MPHSRKDYGYSRTVSYANYDHWSVITQRFGSVTRKVIPFCLANVLIAVGLLALLQYGIDLTISEIGHDFMSVLVAFLVINKLSFTLSLYYELQGHLSTMNKALIELTQLACCYTAHHKEEEFKKWRSEIAFHALVLLKSTVVVISQGGKQKAWEIPELEQHPLVMYLNEPTEGDYENIRHRPSKAYIWGLQLQSDLNLRTPIRIAQRVRSVIMSHQSLPDKLDVRREESLLYCVKDFMGAYHGIRKNLTSPLPFPLVQMARIFVFFYVFTLPFVILSPGLGLRSFETIVLVFIMTYGFIGIELLYVEIDDPFAEDPNDLPLIEEARAAEEDIVLSILDVDGQESVSRLEARFGFNHPKMYAAPATNARGEETDPLLREKHDAQ